MNAKEQIMSGFNQSPQTRQTELLYRNSRRGAVLVLFVILLPVMLILAGFAINWAHLQLVQTEMQVATDASVRAASRVHIQTRQMSQAIDAAQSLANKNLVAGQPLRLRASDFELGRSARARVDRRYDFRKSDSNRSNAMRLTVEKSQNSPSGPVNLIFPMLQGQQTVNMQRSATATQLELDIALVIDRSGSMAFAADEVADPVRMPRNAPIGWFFGDPAPPMSRWLDTVAAVRVFLDELAASSHREQVALASYSTDALLDYQLTEDYGDVFRALRPYTLNFESGATNIGDGMRVGYNHLIESPRSRPWASKIIVVLTDGIYNVGPNPIGVARDIAGNGVMIFTVTFADEANQTDMEEVARIGGGLHFHARSARDLERVFREIAKMMPTLLSQ